jgi:hypothetical protein
VCRTGNPTLTKEHVGVTANPVNKRKAYNTNTTKITKAAKRSRVGIKTPGDTRNLEKNLYYVEAIHGVKLRNGQKYYYVKWMGYPEFLNTWEPYSHIKHTPAFVEFQKSLATTSNKQQV